jgi:glyoxylase-like metal-dependent hydrolase (beta-lactamase superfamily II)
MAGGANEEVEPRVHRYDDGIVAVDTLTGGMTDVTAGYLLEAPRPTLIECGPAKPVEHLLAGLRSVGMDPDDLAYLVLTHIHLDHAGGAGDVAAAFPNATVVVSEVGARHLNDPSRLNRSARQVYGDLFDTIYGPCTPIEAERILGVADGDVLDLGGGRELELLYTPGHAKHHVGVHDHGTDAIFSGDSVGVKLPGMTHLRPATPPADFHLEAALSSLSRYELPRAGLPRPLRPGGSARAGARRGRGPAAPVGLDGRGGLLRGAGRGRCRAHRHGARPRGRDAAPALRRRGRSRRGGRRPARG